MDMRNKGSLSVLFFSFVSRAGVGNFVYAIRAALHHEDALVYVYFVRTLVSVSPFLSLLSRTCRLLLLVCTCALVSIFRVWSFCESHSLSLSLSSSC